jgi:hypothetical protein
MKTLLTLILFVLLSLSVKAQTYVNIGQRITSTDTVTTEIIVRQTYGGSNGQLLYILLDENNTGTVKFSSGQISTANMWLQYGFPAESRVPISIITGNRNLWYKASASGQIFVITN